MKTGKVVIGIDPAFRKNGFGVCYFDLSDRSMSFETYVDILDFQGFLNSNDSPKDAFCVIENSNMQKSTFDMKGSKAEVARKSRNVGKNQAVSVLAEKICLARYGEKNTKSVSPRQKGAKWNATQFKAVIKQERIEVIKKTSNQDERDAAKLALMYRQLWRYKAI